MQINILVVSVLALVFILSTVYIHAWDKGFKEGAEFVRSIKVATKQEAEQEQERRNNAKSCT